MHAAARAIYACAAEIHACRSKSDAAEIPVFLEEVVGALPGEGGGGGGGGGGGEGGAHRMLRHMHISHRMLRLTRSTWMSNPGMA